MHVGQITKRRCSRKEDVMNTVVKTPHELRIPVQQDHIRSIRNPHLESISIIHALVKVRDFPNGHIPDKINPRSHEIVKMGTRIPLAIAKTIQDCPEDFHLLNRGCLIIAKKAWYDNQSRYLHFLIESDTEHGMVDGATTDRVLAELKRQVSNADFFSLKDDEIPEQFKQAYIHVEIVAGEVDEDLRLTLAEARNTSEQVKEFSLQDLGGGYEWLKDIVDKSEFRGKIRYKENEPKPVDIRMVLGLLTLFHPHWNQKGTDPIIAYAAKGTVIDNYKDDEWKKGYEKLSPVALDILRLYDSVHVEFHNAYKDAYGSEGSGAKLGKRKEVRYIDITKPNKAKELPLTGQKTHYVLPDGWLYPLLASLRVLLDFPKSGRGEVKWIVDPFKFFKEEGAGLVRDLVDASEDLGRNANATGKSRRVWSGLRMRVRNYLLETGVVKPE